MAYLVNTNQIFLFVSDVNVLFGAGEPQDTGSFTNGTLKGIYAGYATDPVSFKVVAFSGEFATDGASPTGNMTGAEDIGAPSGPVSGAPFKATYSVSPSPTNGRGTMTVTSGTGGNAIIYMISVSKFVAVSQNDPNPAILEFDLSSAAPVSVTLSSLSVNPTSVTGGNSSTGVYGDSDAERSSSIRRRSGHAFEQQHDSSEGAIQRDSCGRSYERDVYSQHQRRRCIDHS